MSERDELTPRNHPLRSNTTLVRDARWIGERLRRHYRYGDPKPTHCINGHEYTPETVRMAVNDTGRPQRTCRICRNASSRAYLAKKARKRSDNL